MLFKKFYDAAPETPSIASYMANQGVRTNPESTVEVPNINTNGNQPTETPITTTAPVETTKPEVKEEPKVVTETKVEETKPTPTGEPPTALSLSEVLKNHKPEAIFKEIGLDEKTIALAKKLQDNAKMQAFFNHWEEKGDVKPWLNAISTDYSKMSPEDVMRHKLLADNPGIEGEDFETLYRIKVVNRYKLDPNNYSETEVAEGKIELRADARPIREALAKSNEEYLLPQPKDQQPVVDNSAAEEAERKQAWRNRVEGDQSYKDIITNKRISFGEGEEKFNYEIVPQDIEKFMFDSEDWPESLWEVEKSPDGTVKKVTPKLQNQYIVAAVTKNPQGFIKTLADHYIGIGKKQLNQVIENPSQPGVTPHQQAAAPNSPAQAMAQGGRISSGGYQ